MKTVYPLSALIAAVVLSGCNATMPKDVDGKTAGAALGAALGCAGGAVLAKVTGGNAAAGCVAGAVAGGLIGFEKARQEEIAEANRTREETQAVLAKLPPAKGGAKAQIGEVKTVDVTATDKAKAESRKYKAFESVTVDIPTNTRGTPEREEVMTKLRALAEKVADERGSARIEVAMTSADAKALKVDLSSATVQSPKGNPITFSRTADNTVPRGIERITVRAGAIKTLDV